MRGEHTALEVVSACGTTKSGIIDAVRVSEYFGNFQTRGICRIKSLGLGLNVAGTDCVSQKIQSFCAEETCRWQHYAKVGEQKILITCFEIKVSVSDFKSKHGHNFVGNYGFYVVPEEIAKEVLPLVPDHVGLLVFHHKGNLFGIRTKKRPMFCEMTDEDQKWMILSVLKRIRRMER